MIKEGIYEGLKQAVSKGESLEKAMYSFFNAGFIKEDIEDSARALQRDSNVVSPLQPSQAKTYAPVKAVEQPKPQMPVKPLIPAFVPKQPITSLNDISKNDTIQNGPAKVVQKVSEYSSPKPQPPGTFLKIFIVILILALIGIAAVIILVFIYQDKAIEIFTKFFGA